MQDQVARAQAGTRRHAVAAIDQHARIELELLALALGQVGHVQADRVRGLLRLWFLDGEFFRLVIFELDDVDGDILLLAFAPHRDDCLAADTGGAHQARQVGRALDGLAIELENDVAHLDATLLGRPARLHARHFHAARLAQAQRFGHILAHFADLHADAPARDPPGFLELVGDADHFIDGHGEGNAVVAARQGGNLGIDADHLAAHIDQGAARVAGIDGHIALDQGQVFAGIAGLGRNDAGRDGVVEVEGRADRDHPFPHADLA